MAEISTFVAFWNGNAVLINRNVTANPANNRNTNSNFDSINRNAISINQNAILINRNAISINQNAILINRNAISIHQNVIYINRNAILINRDAILTNRNAISIHQNVISINRNAFFYQSELTSSVFSPQYLLDPHVSALSAIGHASATVTKFELNFATGHPWHFAKSLRST